VKSQAKQLEDQTRQVEQLFIEDNECQLELNTVGLIIFEDKKFQGFRG